MSMFHLFLYLKFNWTLLWLEIFILLTCCYFLLDAPITLIASLLHSFKITLFIWYFPNNSLVSSRPTYPYNWHRWCSKVTIIAFLPSGGITLDPQQESSDDIFYEDCTTGQRPRSADAATRRQESTVPLWLQQVNRQGVSWHLLISEWLVWTFSYRYVETGNFYSIIDEPSHHSD